jgi:hypothetical protein
MNVTFADFGDELASSRLRARIPQRELAKVGIEKGNDVLVYGKHFLTLDQVRQYKAWVFDICDDHFNNPELSAYYRTHAAYAPTLTCNSEFMQKRINEETGRYATIVKEPYEGEELEPDIAPELFWFGHGSNLNDLYRVLEVIEYPTHVLTNADGFVPWTPETMDALMRMPSIVIIPTGKSMAKSENRMVEAIRGGHYVCAEYLPSYEPFSPYFKLGDIPKHIEEALSNPKRSLEKIRSAQDFIRNVYSPQAIANQWLEVLHEYF